MSEEQPFRLPQGYALKKNFGQAPQAAIGGIHEPMTHQCRDRHAFQIIRRRCWASVCNDAGAPIVAIHRKRDGGAEHVVGIIMPFGFDQPFGVATIALRRAVRVAPASIDGSRLRNKRPSSGCTQLLRCTRARYSLIVRTTLEVRRPSLTGPFTCFMIASS